MGRGRREPSGAATAQGRLEPPDEGRGPAPTLTLDCQPPEPSEDGFLSSEGPGLRCYYGSPRTLLIQEGSRITQRETSRPPALAGPWRLELRGPPSVRVGLAGRGDTLSPEGGPGSTFWGSRPTDLPGLSSPYYSSIS